jgi:hypothetical protein
MLILLIFFHISFQAAQGNKETASGFETVPYSKN